MTKTKRIKSIISILLSTIFLLNLTYSNAETLGKYGLNTNDNTGSIVDYIIEENNKLLKKNTTVFLIGDYINHMMDFEDLEKDYLGISIEDKLKDNNNLSKELKKPKELFAMYNHNPSVFDNPVSKHIKDNGKWNKINSIEDVYIIDKTEASMRGAWTLTLKGSDDTKKTEWDKYSDDKSLNFIIHEKPESIITQYKPETDSTLYLSADSSYDLDFQYSKSNKGIIKYEWAYQLEDGSWHTYPSENKFISLAKTINGNIVSNYSLTVYDCYNANDTAIASITPPNLIVVVPEINANLYSEISSFMSDGKVIIPSTEEIKVTDIFTRSINFVGRVEFGIYQGMTRKTPNNVLNNPQDILSTDSIETYWKDMRYYQIPPKDINDQYLRDGNYIARIKGIDGSNDLEKEWPIQIKTPIDLSPDMPGKIKGDTSVDIKATTSKYVEKLTIKLYKGESFEKVITPTLRSVGNKKEWKYTYDVPPNLPEGIYIAEFTAVTYNGETDIKEREFILENLDLKDLRITHIVNHPSYEKKYPILYNNPIVPIGYKTGYYVTFKIDAQGNPDTVKMRITYPGYNQEFNMVKEWQSGSDSIWKLDWYADPFTKKGTIINTNVTAEKEETVLNFNNKYGWDGDYLEVVGSIEGDIRIDQEY